MTAMLPTSANAVPQRAGAAVAGQRKRRKTASHERVVVTAVLAFGFAATVLGSVRVAGDVRATRAKELMHGTFTKVNAQQDEFRRVNSRFASWSELIARGARLPARLELRTSSADDSHWYVSIRDRRTGLVCHRVGELTDEAGSIRAPVCRPGSAKTSGSPLALRAGGAQRAVATEQE